MLFYHTNKSTATDQKLHLSTPCVMWIQRFVWFAHNICLYVHKEGGTEASAEFSRQVKCELMTILEALRKGVQTEEEGELAFSHVCQRCRVFHRYTRLFDACDSSAIFGSD